MSDLYVSSAVLDGLRSRLSKVSSRLEGACNELRHADPQVVGAEPLISGMDEFAEGWNHGINQIGQRTESAVRTLVQIGRAFDECDTVLGQALHGAMHGGQR